MRHDSEARLARLAARQHSVFSRAQALDFGVSQKTIRSRVDRGLWTALHRGVYVFASVPIDWQQRITGACLACHAAVASHGSAAVIWDLADMADFPTVTVPISGARSRPGVVIHRSKRLEAVVHRGFRVTNPMRTLLDIASEGTEDALERALDKAHTRGLVDVERLRYYVELPHNASRPGARILRGVVELRDPGRPIESEIETILFRTLRRGGLPPPVVQYALITRTGHRRLDFAYPEVGLAIEVDGYAVHGGRKAFERDRRRQNELESLGWRVLRFTSRQLRSDPVGVVFTVGTALGLAPARWRAQIVQPRPKTGANPPGMTSLDPSGAQGRQP